jgi:hypothetical protein
MSARSALAQADFLKDWDKIATAAKCALRVGRV